ncbi:MULTISPECIES: hypothetical protein [Micromonospora]|uniref:hypothetical protein n=1 Tax=Micromonospora TaxID=1873 RepID=UPI001EE896F6|nr:MULTISPECIES: hypothetical protein [Micromonospora]MCG5453381.1 hypothetical protein [Micromonospora hortensis]MCX5119805.1 hypothetical protein [Micromonospora sp. NBC_00362]WTI08172.1 hypothetical protein OHB44_00300 [Micromonospora sp. NBC_00821]
MTGTPTTATRNVARPSVADRPPRNGVIIAVSVAAGVLLAVLWSYEFVDSVIGDSVASGILGHDAKATAISGTAAGLVFAFVSGLAGTFTACNIAMLASIGPLGAASSANGDRLRLLLRPVGYLTLGMVAVAAVYGFVGVLLGDRLPQLSTDTAGGVPVRIIQSSVVFGVIGLALIYLGLAAIRAVPDVFADRPVARVITLGALIGGFLIGRPYPLFNKLFHWAVDSGNPLYGSAAFVLQSLGNIVVVTALFALLIMLTRGRFIGWLAADVRRSMVISGALLIALGVFTVVYWDVRVPSIFGFGWFPTMFYNN